MTMRRRDEVGCCQEKTAWPWLQDVVCGVEQTNIDKRPFFNPM